MSTFASTEHVTQGWYVMARSRHLRRGRIVTVPVGAHEVVVHRRPDGTVSVMDAQCAHLGSHLSAGHVTAHGLECAFHGWCWGPDGACVRAPGPGPTPQRRTRSYATEERWGLAWAWLGGTPEYGIPDPGVPASWSTFLPRPRVVRCHPHLMLGNGYDLAHVGPAHGFTIDEEPIVRHDPPHRMTVETRGRLPRSSLLRAVGLGGRRYRSTYSTAGASTTLVHIHEPLEFHTLFTGRPDAKGHCRAQTVFFVPRRRVLPRAVALVAATALQDIRVLESMRFRPAFDASDQVLARYAGLVEAMPTW